MTSVAHLSSPLCGSKRGRRSPDSDIWSSPLGKRTRQYQAPERNTAPRRAQNLLQQLLDRFPGMSEKVISSVIDSCEGDLNEALEKLTELSLQPNSSEHGGNNGQAQALEPSNPSSASAADALPSAVTTPTAQQQDSAETERWAVALAADLAGAADAQDMQRRAFGFLSQCKQHVTTREAEKHTARVSELTHQNSLLKKAVAIQHQRGLKAAAERDAEMQQAKRLLDEAQSRNSALEAANYALNVHLKQAMAQSHANGGPPDIC